MLAEGALRYAELGYPVFPCAPGAKTPLTDHGHRDATVDSEQIEAWWDQHPAANVGIATTGLIVIDIDAASTWLDDQPELAMALAAGPLSLTANSGRQHIFRQPAGEGRHHMSTPKASCGASWRNTAGRLAPHVDTRADGGYIVVPPSVLTGDRRYRWAEGMELDDPPENLPEPPGWLIEQLDRLATSGPMLARVATGPENGNRIPSGQRNATLARLGGAMRRVGMTENEIFAALERTNVDRCSPSLDRSEVQRIAISVARYAPDEISVALAENHYAQDFESRLETSGSPAYPDPGPMPESLCRIPGFVAGVMDHCLATAPYPNIPLAFCGALALQAVLTGRKVRDEADNRTNIYLLALAFSAVGKDWPRKVNTAILHQVGLVNALGEKFASGEGIQDSLFLNPSMLFQTDEVDGLLQSINKARDARHENILGTLLTMYSAANSIYPMRRKAGKEPPGVIDQPCLVVYGTAIPTHYYSALSERMLTNGFFARMLIVESGRRSAGQDAGIIDPPKHLIETAQWWADFCPGSGNLESWHPEPRVVLATVGAKALLAESRQEAESEYAQSEARGDPVGTTVWGRVHEQIRKLALLYAVSANHTDPVIDDDAVRWAREFAMHQTRRMLFMAGSHSSETEFEQRCQKVVEALAEWSSRHGDAWMPYRDLSRRFRWSRREHEDIRNALSDQERIEIKQITTGGRPRLVYRTPQQNPAEA